MDSKVVVVIGILVVLGVVVVAVPLVDIVIQEPYTSMENMEAIIGSTSDRTIEGGYYITWTINIPVGRDIEFSAHASDTVDLYVFSVSQYNNYQDGGGGIRDADNEKDLIDVERGTLGYHVSASGNYHFCIYNPHDGFFGIGKQNVGIYTASITSYWTEEVTKYRTVTKKVPILTLLTGAD